MLAGGNPGGALEGATNEELWQGLHREGRRSIGAQFHVRGQPSRLAGATLSGATLAGATLVGATLALDS